MKPHPAQNGQIGKCRKSKANVKAKAKGAIKVIQKAVSSTHGQEVNLDRVQFHRMRALFGSGVNLGKICTIFMQNIGMFMHGGHMFPLEHPEEVAALVTATLTTWNTEGV